MLVKEHNNNNNRATGLIFQNYSYNLPIKTRVIVSLDDYRSSSSSSSNPPLAQIHNILDILRIFHSCNGLLVLKSTARLFAEHEYYVYNPTTKQITTPLLKDEVIKSREGDRVRGMYLAFDPSKSPHYKVVCVWQLDWMVSRRKDEHYQFEVYSSKTGSWEISGGGGHITKGILDLENGVYWNGAIHWVGLFGNSMFFNPDEHDEMPHLMPDPPFPSDGLSYYFGVSCDHLHFAVVGGGDDHNLPHIRIYVYEMMRDYSEWFLKYKVDYSSQCLECIFSVVRGKDKDEDENYSLLVLGNAEGEIICYNLVHNTFQTIQVEDFDIKWLLTKSFQYIESPCSV